jgi:predicted dehydrogenase
MRFAKHIVAQISCGFRRPLEWGAALAGTDRSVYIEAPWKPGAEGERPAIRVRDRAGGEEVLAVSASDPYLCEVEAMEACVLDGAPPVVPLSLSRQILSTVLALYESATAGRSVSLPSS